MTQRVTRFIKRIAQQAGFEIHRRTIDRSYSARLSALLRWQNVSVVFDVGANIGQYSVELRESGYRGRIVSFEPLAAAHAALLVASATDDGWQIGPRVAIGAADGSVEINVSDNVASSSVLPLAMDGAGGDPDLTYVRQESVPLAPLDALAPEYLRPDDRVFVKIDTQGYEAEVLDGATSTLDRAIGVQIELSLVPIYEGQALYRSLLDRLEAAGFSLHAIFPGYSDRVTGRMLQMDAVMFKA